MSLKKSTNHESFDSMTKGRAMWWLDNVRYVVLQLFDADGDALLCCRNGRTRSPMYLVAYLVIIYNMTTLNAKKVVAKLLHESRGMELDRFDSLGPLIEKLNDDL